MRPKLTFHRILLDLDLALGPVGVAIELYEDGERSSLVVLECPGPFDTPQEALERAVDAIATYYGAMRPLL